MDIKLLSLHDHIQSGGRFIYILLGPNPGKPELKIED